MELGSRRTQNVLRSSSRVISSATFSCAGYPSADADITTAQPHRRRIDPRHSMPVTEAIRSDIETSCAGDALCVSGLVHGSSIPAHRMGANLHAHL